MLISRFYDVALLPVSAGKRMRDSSSASAPSRERPERQRPLIGQSVVVSPHGRSPERRPIEFRPPADSRLL